MPEHVTGTAPECPFLIEYSAEALEGIRIAVADAFFALPRVGIEAGGVLLGKWEDGSLAISGYTPLDCEHAFGPGFKLSERDKGKLRELIASAAGELCVVGWYHSHTRTAVLLSQEDLELYNEFFAEPWQVALVLKPYAFRPMRAGFFFREPGGSVHCEAAYDEFTLEPHVAKAVEVAPADAVPAPAPSELTPAPALPEEPPLSSPEHTAAPAAVTPNVALAAEPAVRAPLPQFLNAAPPPMRRWPRVVIPLATAAALVAGAYWQRDMWMPKVLAMTKSEHAEAPPALGLNAVDLAGQLQIRWNRNAPAVAQAAGGVLNITGASPAAQEIALDQPHLLSGFFTVERQAERIDVSLTVTGPDGQRVREDTIFLGSGPARPSATAADAAAQAEQDALKDEVRKMRTDLDDEIQRNRKLQRSVDLLTRQLLDQIRGRGDTPAGRK
jgi:proteasome lid subunit RPN8/RPN11